MSASLSSLDNNFSLWLKYNSAVRDRRPKWALACDCLQLMNDDPRQQRAKILYHPTFPNKPVEQPQTEIGNDVTE